MREGRRRWEIIIRAMDYGAVNSKRKVVYRESVTIGRDRTEGSKLLKLYSKSQQS